MTVVLQVEISEEVYRALLPLAERRHQQMRHLAADLLAHVVEKAREPRKPAGYAAANGRRRFAAKTRAAMPEVKRLHEAGATFLEIRAATKLSLGTINDVIEHLGLERHRTGRREVSSTAADAPLDAEPPAA